MISLFPVEVQICKNYNSVVLRGKVLELLSGCPVLLTESMRSLQGEIVLKNVYLKLYLDLSLANVHAQTTLVPLHRFTGRTGNGTPTTDLNRAPNRCKTQLCSCVIANWLLTEELLRRGVNFKVAREQFLFPIFYKGIT